MSDDLYAIKAALLWLPQTCRYHGVDFDKSGYLGPNEGGQPRCESCRPAWRRMCGLAALQRVDERVRR